MAVPKVAVRTTPAPKVPSDLTPLSDAAYYGLAGEIVKEIEPHTESDPAAVLVQFLAAVGSALGHGPGFQVEAERHHCNLFVGIVGDTASGRKGSSWSQARRLVIEADPTWADRIATGASSGEGLIWHVRDAESTKRQTSGKSGGSPPDPGVSDKRLLVIEPELASVLDRIGREGNTLSAILRQAWDSGKLDTLVKNNPATATDAHISLIGHITGEELRRKLTATEQANGFANRFIWIYSRRSKLLPWGGNLASVDWEPYVARLRNALKYQGRNPVGVAAGARMLWERAYKQLSAPQPGMVGAITARGAPQVRRLAVIYAVLDRRPNQKVVVTGDHLRAALAIWRYAADTAALLFGSALGDPTADALLVQLRAASDGMSRKELHDAFGRHLTATELDRALDALAGQALARSERRPTAGRTATRWFAADPEGEPTAVRKKRAKRPKKAR